MPDLTYEEWMRMSDEDRRKNIGRISEDEMWKVRLTATATPRPMEDSEPLYSDEEWARLMSQAKNFKYPKREEFKDPWKK